jgi:predicted signal transduction protein with EAL and GGDEF domain
MLGHASGDLVLQAISERLKAAIPPAGTVARLSGDEFCVVAPMTDIGGDVGRFAERIGNDFETPLIAGNRQHRVRVSIGAAVFPDGGRTADELLSNGHLALSRAKATRRGGHVLFEDSIRHELETRLTLEAELELAAERNEFELFYQPQLHLADGRLIGAEALIRWRHPVRGLVSPAEFMPVVNTSPISERIAEWVLETACTTAAAWERAGYSLRIGVNLSPSQFRSGDLASSVAQTLARTGLSPTSLELEFTEDILLHDEQGALNTFLKIQELGVRIVFDDFGTGFASLSYLKKFPLDGLKIDRSFVLGLLANLDDAAIVSSTISLGKQLGLSVIAEGIENRATADFLVSMGCEEGQGYFFGRPMPAVNFEQQHMGGAALALSASG